MNDGHDTERTLELARRIDWRFLLPHASLGAVACVGAIDSELLEALRRFARSVAIIEAANSGADGAFDLLVTRNPGAIAPAHRRLLKQRGCLYVEVERRTVRQHINGLIEIDALTHSAAASGFIDVQLHWHWPAFSTCTRILPVNDPAALASVVGRGRTRLRSSILRAGARFAIRAGVIPRTVPCVSLTARAA